jgi:molybdopterin-guanine dinucleotide biosynthesis protein A
MTDETDFPLPPAVLLAGGRAQRMGGGDKPLRSVGGIALLTRVITALEPQCDVLVINANGDPERFSSFGLPVMADAREDFAGPLAGILAGMDWVITHRPQARWLLSVAADCPFLPSDLVMRLEQAQQINAARIAVASSGGAIHPVIALWDVGLRDDLYRSLHIDDRRKVRSFIESVPFAIADWPATSIDPFFNANTEDDLREAERLLAHLS